MMKKRYVVPVLLFAVIVIAAIVIYLVSQNNNRVFFLTYKGEPFRRDVQLTFVRRLAEFDEFDARDVKIVELPSETTTDSLNWDDYRKAKVIVCTLALGRNPLPTDLPLVCGPIRSSDRDFAARNGDAIYLLSDICDLPVVDILSKQLAIPGENIYFGALGASGISGDPFSNLAGLKEGSYRGLATSAVDELPEGSLLFVACDGVEPLVVSELAAKALMKRIAIVVDRTGYLNFGVLAQYSVDPETVGDSLARMTLKMVSGAVTVGEIREVSTILKLFSVSTADRLGIVPKQDGFIPMP